ncbi:hypothetical protein L1887_05185 [Cichorium endivia]|nr:hypothetical protein L1887_05185 [Cichorium endivia]
MLPLASCSLQKIVKQIKEAIAINRNGNASDNIIDVKRTLREMKILITPAIVSFLIFFLLFSPAIDIVVDLLFVVRDMSNPNVFKFIASKYYVVFGSLKQNQRAPLLVISCHHHSLTWIQLVGLIQNTLNARWHFGR